MTPPLPSLSDSDGPWIEQWLTAQRLQTYIRVTASRSAALQLYEWNAAVSLALHRDIGHVEVALRNAYDKAIDTHWSHDGHWTDNPSQLFPVLTRRRGTTFVDINAKNRSLLSAARHKAGGETAPPGKVIAELTFGFWRYLTSRAHETTLWTPYLHHAYPTGTSRRTVDASIVELYRLRNRIAHHEPLVHTDLIERTNDIITVATWLNPNLGDYLTATSPLPVLLSERPT